MVAVGNRGRISPVSSLTQKAPRLSMVGGLFCLLRSVGSFGFDDCCGDCEEPWVEGDQRDH